MNRPRFLVFAAILALVLCARAPAQTISIVSGNGQMICQSCSTFAGTAFKLLTFDPLVVKVTDASSNPVPNATVTWAVTAGGFGGALVNQTTVTDINGVSSNTFVPGFPTFSTIFQSFTQTTITAATNATAIFTLTQLLLDPSNPSVAPAVVTALSLPLGTTLTGPAGTSSGTTIQIQVASPLGAPIPSVNLFLVNSQDPKVGPTAQCASGAGAGLNTVLTDSTGTATCTPVFGGQPGSGSFQVFVGGVPSGVNTQTPLAFAFFNPIGIQVTPATPAALIIKTGNNQSANAGQSLAASLVVEVEAASGSPLAGQQVTWTVTPAGAATVAPVTGTSDVNGLVSASVLFASNVAGQVQVKATLSSNTNLSATFTATALAVVGALQKLSGDAQTAKAGTAFAQPLIVQVNANNGQPLANVPVQFSVSGPATLSAATVNTDNSGRAQVTVTAGATAGAVTVTASTGSFSTSFGLTVSPPGPILTASSFLNGADFQRGSISPCSVGTIFAAGLAPGLQGVVVGNALFGPLPFTVANVTISFNSAPAPIYAVSNLNGQEQVTFQVPCDVTPGSSVPVTVSVGTTAVNVNVPVLAASPGIFLTTMSDGQARAVLVRPDGSFVSLTNPARKGEVIRAFVTGLGTTAPAVGTNSVAISGTDSKVLGTVIVGMTNSAGGASGITPILARAAPDLIGVQEVTFQVPADAATGNNVLFSVAVIPSGSSTVIYSNAVKIAVQ